MSDTAHHTIDSTEAWQTYRSLVLALNGGPQNNIDYQQWLAFNLKRGQFRQLWKTFFEDWDVMISPITSTTAFRHDHSPAMSRVLQVNGEQRGFWEHVFWAGFASMPYLPATVFPTGVNSAANPR